MIIIAAETFVQHSVEIRRWILDIDRKTRRWKILQQRRRRQWWNDARIGDSLTLAALSYQQTVVVFAASTGISNWGEEGASTEHNRAGGHSLVSACSYRMFVLVCVGRN